MRSPEVIIRSPLLTEKNLIEQEKKGSKYAFVVDKSANKIEIKNAVEVKFNVSVASVSTANVKGKAKRMNTRRGLTSGKRASWKKAIVTLRGDDAIDFFQ